MIDYSLLDPTFVHPLQQLIANMEALGHTVNPYYGIRTLADQARIWRRSRTTVEVQAMYDILTHNNAPYALSVLKSVGAQPSGAYGTGTYLYSYHLIGKACDMFVDGDMAGGDVYDILATEALKVGLTPGRNFHIPDSGHVQLGVHELTATYTIAEMDIILKGIATS